MKECVRCNRCYENNLKCCPHDGEVLAETLPGTCLIDSKYNLEFSIGRGGMGAVYKANHIHLDRPFAIKTILPEFASRTPNAAEKFLQEAKSAAAIQHPNVVAITDFGTTKDGLFYYVMEYIEGRTLRDELHKNGSMQPARIHKLFKQVLSGVAAAHRLHIVHRDLKPSNIVLAKLQDKPVEEFKLLIPLYEDTKQEKPEEQTEIAKVVDFGLARFVNDSIKRKLEQSETGLVGSPFYMSPEQCDGASADERSDIYSLGVILFHMLTGEVPFKGDNLSAVLTGHLMKEPPSLRAIKPEIPEKLEKVVLRALAKKPLLRHQTISDFLEEFESAMALYLAPESSTVTLSVQTQPPACEVYIDDEYKGRTGVGGKLVIKGLQPGTHRVRITLTGYLEWNQSFTAGVGDFSLVAELKRKEDLAFAASAAKTRFNGGTQRLRPTGSLAVTNPSRSGEYITTDLDMRVITPKSSLSSTDLILSIFAIALVSILFFIFSPVDPVSFILSEKIGFPVEKLVGVATILSVIGLTSSMVFADYVPEYRNSSTMSSLFHLSSTIFLLTFIIPMVAAVPMKLSAENPETAQSNLWFAGRLLAIACCFLLQRRVSSRRRVTFLS